MNLVNLSIDAGFLSKDKLVFVNPSYYYLWMCELSKWIREEHDINVIPYRTWAMDNSYNYEIIVGADFDNIIQQECKPNRTYEEALEDGHKEALKLIE